MTPARPSITLADIVGDEVLNLEYDRWPFQRATEAQAPYDEYEFWLGVTWRSIGGTKGRYLRHKQPGDILHTYTDDNALASKFQQGA